MRAHLARRYMAALVIITAMLLDNDMFAALPDNRTNAAPPLRIASPSPFIAYRSHPSPREDPFRALTPSSPRTSDRPRPGSHSSPPPGAPALRHEAPVSTDVSAPPGPPRIPRIPRPGRPVPRPRRSAAALVPLGEAAASAAPAPTLGAERAEHPLRGAAARMALGAGELPGRLLALLWPALVLAAAAAALLVLRGLRDRGAEEEEDGPAGAGGRAAGALPARQPEEQRRTAQVPANGHLITSVNIREKKLLKPKKKRKNPCTDKEVPKGLLSVEKDKLQEEEGVWQTKISSREKRHLRKERLKQKDPSRASLGSSAVEPAFDWDEKGAVWPLTEDTGGGGKGAFFAKAECGTVLKGSGALREESAPSRSEDDVFSNVGTWDIADVKSCPVTFGTLSDLSRDLDNVKGKSSEDSPSRCCWHGSSTFLPADDAWQGQGDPSVIDLDSDWKAPTEEWGNWTGDEEHQTRDEKKDLPKGKAGISFCLSGPESKTQRKKKKMEVKEARGGAGLRHPQQGLQTRMEEGPRDLISTKHSSDAVGASFEKSLDIVNNSPNNSVPGKKEKRKRKKMKKET
ncbi:protein LYRIC-like [Hirundo rustica]|uniref:protein LYRIC-like n=1 Tax=Hirundo rustica TaxID=43150 RepID=UPI001A94793F|nr:protein LYRIC-like [Hirundo rustica]